MARNQRTQTKTTVTPNIRPVDTFVQAAPVDDSRLRELSNFLSSMTPRVKQYAQIEQGRRDKKDILSAQKAFTKVTDKLLEYDELVKAKEKTEGLFGCAVRASVSCFQERAIAKKNYDNCFEICSTDLDSM